jgi:hypothetical protein
LYVAPRNLAIDRTCPESRVSAKLSNRAKA